MNTESQESDRVNDSFIADRSQLINTKSEGHLVHVNETDNMETFKNE